MRKIIAIALLVGSIITAFHGFALTAPSLIHKSMNTGNSILGNISEEIEIPANNAETGSRSIPAYFVAVLSGGAGFIVLSCLREDDEDFF